MSKSLFFRQAVVVVFFSLMAACQKKGPANTPSPQPQPQPPVTPAGPSEVAFWLTEGDGSPLLEQQNIQLNFGTTPHSFPTIDVDSSQGFQTVEGFGYTLTGGSAMLINGMGAARQHLLNELFSVSGIGISYLRLSMGASDLDPVVFSYNDLPAGATDTLLAQFSLGRDTVNLIPLLKEIKAIQPGIRLLATPWSPPAWMKDNNSPVGGSLLPQYYRAYARYFVKYIQQMHARGLTIGAVTIQNEPLHPGNNPSMYMTAAQQAAFIKNHLGPAFAAAGIQTKIIIYDHNCDKPEYPLEILNDPAAKAYVEGSAFHLYAGNINILSQVHNQHPDKGVYFTEQYTASNGEFGGDLKWHLKNVIIGSMRNWSRVALEWNLANDPAFGPHTPGGCTTCKGALTIGADVTRNVAYYIIAHASKFVPPGSVRIASDITGNLHNVAFRTPSGKKVVIVENDGNSSQSFAIRYKNKWFSVSLGGGAVGTFIW